jgi:hypothetical protein
MEIIKLDMNVEGAYQPKGCTRAYITGLFWDSKNHRPAVSVIYDNGATDWLPLSEMINQHFKITNDINDANCIHEWGTDGQHSNVYCKKCFIDKPATKR